MSPPTIVRAEGMKKAPSASVSVVGPSSVVSFERDRFSVCKCCGVLGNSDLLCWPCSSGGS